jgi:hypothetical protein
MLDIIKTIRDVGSRIFGLREKLAQAKREERDRAAKYFSDLAELIEDVAAQLRNRVYPGGSCAQMEQQAKLMPKTLKGILPDADLVAYRDKLLSVHAVEGLFDQLGALDDPARLAELKQLDEAAGYFRAVAAHLRVAAKG